MNTKSNIAPSKRTKKDYKLAALEGWKTCARMKVAEMEGNRSGVLEEVQRNYKRARFFGFNKLLKEYCWFLQNYYYIDAKDKRLGKKYAELTAYYNEIGFIETKVASKFSDLFYRLDKTRTPDDKVVEELRIVCKEFESYLEYDSVEIWIFVYTLLNIRSYIDKDYEEVVNQSYAAIDYLDIKGIDRTSHFYKDATPALIHLGRYEEAEKAIELASDGFPKQSSAFAVFIYYKIVATLHQGHYQKAYDLFISAQHKKQIAHESLKETFLVLKGYFNFLMEAGALKGYPSFRVGKFVNNIRVFVSDKAGQNANVVILKVLLRLCRDRSRMIDEWQSIKLYSERYLESGSRIRLFFQMLNQIVPGNFDQEVVRHRGDKYFRKLPVQAGYDPDMEVVPYEVLWGLVLGVLAGDE